LTYLEGAALGIVLGAIGTAIVTLFIIHPWPMLAILSFVIVFGGAGMAIVWLGRKYG